MSSEYNQQTQFQRNGGSGPNQCHQNIYSGCNQTSQFPMFNQVLPSSQNHSVQKSMLAPISQTAYQSNAFSHFNASDNQQTQQKDHQQQSYVHNQFNAVSYRPTSNTHQPLAVPCNASSGLTSAQSIPNQNIQHQQSNSMYSAPNQTSQFSMFNQMPPNSQHQSVQKSMHAPVSQTAYQSNVDSQQTQQKYLQQQNYVHRPFNATTYQTSNIQQPSTVHCNVPSGLSSTQSTPNQHILHQQSGSVPFAAKFNQMPPNSQHQSVQNTMLAPVSQSAYQSNTINHFNASDSQQTQQKYCQQQSYVYHQFNAMTSNTQQSSTVPHNVPSGLNNNQSIPIQHIQHQKSNSVPSAPNKTSQFPVCNQLPLNSQYQPDQRLAATTASQRVIQTNVNSSFSSAPSNQQEKHLQPTKLYHQPSIINQPLYNNKTLGQQENINLQQQAQHCQPIAVGHQIGNPQQSFSITSGSVSAPSPICSPYNQNSKPPEVNRMPQIPSYNNLPSSQHQLHQTPVVSSHSQVSAPVAAQPNLSTSAAVLQYGPTSNFTNSFLPTIPMQHPFGNYQTVGSVSEASNVKSQSEIDSEWASQWLIARKNGKVTTENRTSAIPQIPEVRKLLSQAFTFLKALAFVRDSLKSSRSESDEAWDNKIKQAINIKQRLDVIMQKLLKPETTRQLVRKANKIKKKRELHRRQREKRKMERLEQQKKRLEIHRLLDSYMETEKEKVLQAKREEEMKKEADNILSEVRKKLQEGKRAQERLKSIEKLRQARKDTAQKRGLHISEETDNQFSKKVSLLKDIMHKQLQDYEAEEKALKVMLETEQEGQREQEETYRKERQKKLVNNVQKQIKECLFGDDKPLDASNSLWYFRQYYTQAERSLDALVQIRHQWDIYLVRSTDACGSSIPVSWVTPEPPSSHTWASALALKEYE